MNIFGIGKKPADRQGEFERLVSQIVSELYGMALRLTRHPDNAHDLLQDTLIRGWDRFYQFQPGSNFRAWMFKILLSVFYNQHKKGQRQPRFVSLDQMLDQEDSNWEPASLDASPEEWLMNNTMEEPIERALASLSSEYRDTVLLVDVHTLSYEEAAQVLEVPVGTVRSRLFRGRLQLRNLLQDYAQTMGHIPEGGSGYDTV
jgi:RNA polymerase sigma-70 factor (ECF subfamily)